MDQANHQPKEQSAEQRKGRGPGRPFQKGQSGNPAGRPPGMKSPVEDAEAELLESLALMKRVLKQDESQDRTNEERHYRGWLKENRSAFMAKKADLERALLAREPEGPAPRKPDDPLPPDDESTERALAAIQKMMEYRNRKQAEEDAELAKRPNAAQFAGKLQKSLAEALRREAALQAEVDELRKKVGRNS